MNESETPDVQSQPTKLARIHLCLQNARIGTFVKIYQKKEDIYPFRASVIGAVTHGALAALSSKYLLQAWGLQHPGVGRI